MISFVHVIQEGIISNIKQSCFLFYLFCFTGPSEYNWTKGRLEAWKVKIKINEIKI